MSEQFTIERHGHRIEVESDESLVVVARVRLFIDGKLADERSTLWEVRLRGELPDGGKARPVKVKVSYGTLGGVRKCVLIEDGVEYPMSEDERKLRDARREAAPSEADKERELLAAMKENRGRISAVKAATETSLSVKEAEEMLSGLAPGGHLLVERNGGSLVYLFPGSSDPEVEGR